MKSNRGFSLIETLIAITILMTAIVGPLVLAARGLFASSYAKDQITAYYLAQEALEVVRGIRDDNSLNGAAWDANITANCALSTGGPCVIDSYFVADSARLIRCPGATAATCPKLKQFDDAASGLRFYHQGSKGPGDDAIFQRVLTVSFPDSTVPNNVSEALMTVDVSWNSGLITQHLSLSETMFDWK